jgi:hypothetical protein
VDLISPVMSEADALVAVQEGVVAYQRETQRRRLLGQARMQLLACERHLRLGERRLQPAEVVNTAQPPGLFQDQAVQLQDLLQG